MKLLELHLKRFGPFTDRRLELGEGEQGLHVVFGANEAGKTSALRAIGALLYGIDERTGDDFVHARSLLRIGARLRARDGAELLCYRRKGRKNTLVDEHDKPLPEGELLAMLGGVDAGLFAQLFGIDHAALVRGGRSLLDEHGREAEALFGAGVGGTALHEFLATIEAEANELFLPRGTKPLLNAAIAELASLQRQVRDVSLAASRWDETRRQCDAARRELSEAEAAFTAASQRRSLLERVRRSRPRIAQRAHILARLAEIGPLPRLPDDFGARRRAALASLEAATERETRARGQRDELAQRLDGLSLNRALVAEASSITPLIERLGSHAKAMLDRPGLAADRDRLAGEALAALSAIRPEAALDAVDELRPLLQRHKRVAALVAKHQRLVADHERVTRAAAAARARLDALDAKLAEHPRAADPGTLREAITLVRRAGDVDAAIAEAARRLAAQQERLTRELRALGRWPGTAQALLAAPLPAHESVRLFDERFTELAERRRQLAVRETAVREQIRESESTLETLRLSGDVPSEAELSALRERREQGWQLVREHWQGGIAPHVVAERFDPARPLPEAYETVVGEADLVADRLRREAGAVQRRATTQAHLESARRQLADIEREQVELAREHDALDEEWRALWAECGLQPATPREMSAWLDQAQRLRDLAREGDELAAGHEHQRHARRAAREALCRQLELLGGTRPASAPEDDADAPLAPLVALAEQRLASIEEARRLRAALEEDLERLQREAGDLDAEAASVADAMSAWRDEWVALCAAFGVDTGTTPEEMLEHLQALARVVALHDKAVDLERRVAAIDAEAKVFDEQATRLLESVAPDLLDEARDTAVRALAGRLREQIELGTRFDDLTRQLADTHNTLAEAAEQREAATRALAELCRVAGCEHAQLAEVETRHLERLRLEQELQTEERELRAGGDGLDIDALLAEAGGLSADDAASELANLVEEMEHVLQPRVRDLARHLSEAEQALAGMRGGDEAALLAERCEQQMASVRHLAERYLRARVASFVLRDEMERFRQAHRDPILERASGFFGALTSGAFAAVETMLDSDDQPVLIARRASGERLTVEAMSTGTRDQLYLALRLATLAKRLESAEPLPFIVDDILVQFDDARTFATLGVLAEFSRATQVILFTHHGRVAERARELERAGGGVFVHELAD